MKTIILFVLSLLFTINSIAATEQDPKGLYRLSQFIYQDGRQNAPSFNQYKYAADSVGLLINYQPSGNNYQWSRMTIEIREPLPLKYTGEIPQGADGHGIQIFNVSDKQFYFKWYNTQWPNMSQLNEFITEVYTKDNIQDDVAQAFTMLEDEYITTSAANKFCGWWTRIAATNSAGNKNVQMIWKSYSPTMSMVVTPLNNGRVLGCYTSKNVKYENDSTIYEIGHPCKIKWLNDNIHSLTYKQNAQEITEIWVRGGLPHMWQEIFNTDIECYRDGTSCMQDAANAGNEGDTQKAEQYISEAITKGVAINALSEGVYMIASKLLTDKKYAECKDFCMRYIQTIDDYAKAGNDHNVTSKFYRHLIDVCHADATYRVGDTEKGKKMIEDNLAYCESEIERYKKVSGMELYVNALYICNLMTYDYDYDVLGIERTLLYLDAYTLMAPSMVSQQKPIILNIRGKCYLLNGDTESAKKIWQQLKDTNPEFVKKQPSDNPMKKAFGE